MIENNSMSFFFQFFFMQQKVGQIQYLPFRSEFRRILVYSHNERSSIYIQEHRHHRSYKERLHTEARNKVNIPWIIQFVFKELQRVFITKHIEKSYQRTVVMEGSICMELVSFCVLVCGQQLTQIKTFRVRIRCHVERITIWFTNTKKTAVHLISHHG